MERLSSFSSMKIKPPVGGFATILALLIIALLVVVLVGAAMILRVETFTSSNAQKIAEARQNALFGLESALADLQELAGPDQRVTATADILNTGNATLTTSTDAPTVLGKTKWTGVWKRDDAAGDTPLNPTDDKSPKWLGWLVSGPEGKIPEGNTSAAPQKIQSPASAADSSVTLVGNSVSAPDDQIAVTLESIFGNTGKLAGRYGFWVGDEGVKARFNMDDPPPSPTDMEARNAFFAPPTMNMKETDLLGSSFPTDGTATRAISTEQIPYLSGNSSLDGKDKSLFHSLTAWSKGVLADTRLGGLRKDLSRILYNSTIGPTDDTPLYPDYLLTDIGLDASGIPTSNDVYGFRAPTWGLLRSWANNTVSANATSVTAREAGPGVSSVAPVVLYYNLGFGATFVTTNATTGSGNITPYIFPTVILWNPYTVPLDPPANGYELGIKMGNPNFYSNTLQFGSNMTTTGNATVVHDLQEFCLSSETWLPSSPPSTTLPSTTGKLYRFSLAPIPIPPGEALVYAVDSPGDAYTDGMLLSLKYSPHNSGARIGSPLAFTPSTTANQVKIGGRGTTPQNSCYLIAKPAGNTTVSIDKTSPCFVYITGETGTAWTDYALTGNKTAQILNSTPTIRFSNGGVHAMGQLKLAQATGAVINYDFRWLMNFNPRGMVYFGAYPWKSSTQSESPTSKSRSFPMGLFERMGVGFSPIIPYSDTFGHIENIGNDLGSTVSLAPAPSMGGRFALFDLPRTDWPLFSVADLRHADLVRQSGGPPYAIGGSLATIGLLREEDHRTGFPNYVDWSHVLNRELWDAYYFSTVPSNLPSDYRDQPLFQHLPNARMHYYGNATNTDLLDKDKAAASLTLEGAFNINSTSEDAWVALLSDRVGLKYDVKTAKALSSGTLSGAAFSRFNQPINSPALPPGVGTSGDPWSGYRSLNEAQIRELAKAIVAQIKSRASALGGPFLSLGEFINRRLVPKTDPHADQGLSGALQSAIDSTTTINTDVALNSNTMTAGTLRPSNFDSSKSDWDHWRGEPSATTPTYPKSSRNAGIPGMLIQPDLLAAIGPHIAARSDTFRIRSYGDVVNPSTNKVEARAWCEAVVQRLPEYLDASDPPETPTANLTKDINTSAGRRFKVVSFRWLTPDEV